MTPKKIRQISIRLLISFCGIFTSLQVYSQCVTSITTAPVVNTICNGQTITLTASNPGASGFTWAPAATLNTNTGASVIASPTSTTTYTVTTSGCSPATPVTVVVTVLPSPNAAFSFSPNNAPCSSTPINFSNSSTGSGLTYSWNFGNPASGSQNTSTSTNPSHLFVAYGVGNSNFNVTLTATSSNGCSDNISQTVTVQNSPNASITDPSGNDFSNCDGISSFLLSINNSSTTQSTNTNYVINWGDGTPNYSGPTLPDGTTHTYNGFGFNTITLTVTGSNGCVSNSTYNFFNGSNPSVGLANPGGTVGLCAPAILSFPVTNTALNPPGTTYTVEYNDGSPNEVYTHPPPATIIHTFNNSSCGVTSLGGFQNAFHVRIVASNPCGTSAALIEPIRVGLPPTVAFNGPSVVCVNTTASYNSSSTGIVVNNAGNCVNTINHFWSVTPSTGWSIASGSFGNSTTNVSGSTSIGLNYSQPGIYTIQLIAKNQCGADTLTQNVCVTVPPTPSFTINPTSACAPALITTTNNSTATACSPLTYSWSVTPTTGWSFASGNSTSVAPSFNFTEAGSYTITLAVTNVCGTFNTSQPVILKTIPSVTLPTYPANCGSISINPSATINDGGGTISSYSWTFSAGTPSTSSLANPPSVNFNTPGNHVITLTVTNECGSATATTSVTVNPLPNVSTISNTTICNGEVVNLVTNPTGGSSPYSFSWSPGTGLSNPFAQSPNANPSSTTTYSVTVTDLNLCTASTSTIITVNPIPIVSISGIQTICDGQQTNLSASGATTYTWSPTSSLNTSTGNSVTASPTITTTYTVIGSFSTGCSATTTYIVTVNPLPVVNAGPDISVCNQPIATVLTGFSPAGGVWSGPGVTASGVFTPSATGTFTLYYSFTNANGCSGIDSILVSVISSLLANAGNGFSICVNAPAFNLNTLNPTPVGGTWSGNGVVGGNFNPAGLSGQQILTYSLGAGTCLTTDTIHIFVNPLPVMNVNSPVFCIEDDATLTVNGANTYSWSPSTGLSATTGNSVIANPTLTTTYTITGTNTATGCTNTINSVVTVNPLPVLNAGPDISVCNQPIATVLTGFSPAGGVWSGPGVTGAGVFTPSAVGTFTLIYTFTNSNSCVNKDSIIVSVIDPTLANAGTGFGICVSAPPVNLSSLNPTPVGGTWSGNGVVGSSFNPAGLNGQQILTYTVGTGTCLTTDTIRVNVHPLPVLNVNSGTICIEDDITLTAGGANTYVWSPSAGLSATTGGSVIANPTITTTYTITGTNTATGCTNTINSVVTVNPLPVVNAGPDISVCNQPIATQLSGFSPAGGVWSGPGVTGAGVFTPSAVGTFTLIYTFTNSNSCVNKDSIIVSVIDPTLANAGTGFGICVTAPPVNLSSLNPTPTGGAWSGSGVSGTTFNPAGLNGLQILTYTVGSGTCLTTDTIRVNVHPLPVLNVNSGTICIEDDITLTAGGANTYVWSPSAGLSATTGGSVTANPTLTTTYTITGTNTSTGCTNTINSVVTVNPLPVVNAGPDISVCNQPIIEILTGYTPAGGTWSGPGVSGSGNFTPSGVGNFTLIYTFVNANLCVNKDSIVVSVINPSVTNAGTGFSICNQAATVTLNTLNPTPAGGSWTGNGVNANIFDPTTVAPGQYILTYTVGAGTCQTSDTIRVTVNPNPNPVVPNTAYCFGETGTITINGTDNYVWSPATDLNTTSGNSVITSTQSNTTYTVTATNSFNCSTNVSTNVVVHPLPIITLNQNPVSICYNSSVNITASGASQYQWIPDIGLNQSTGASITISTTVTTTYTVTGTTGFGCIDSVFLPVSVNDPTDANPTNDAICFGGNTTLTVTNASTYFWSPAAGLSSQTADMVTANPQVSTTYTVVGTTSSGCTSSDIVPITVNPLPVVSIAPSSITQCAESPATLNADGALNYLWSPNISLSASTGNSVIVNPNTNTTYSVLGTDNNGCTGSATTTITVYPLPAIDAGSNITVCHTGITVTLGGFTPQGGTWNGPGIINGTGALFDPLNAGLGVHTVYYNIINANGCTNIDSITITVTPVTYPVAGPGDTLCFLDPVINLTGNAPAGGTWLGFGITNAVTGQFNPTLTGPGLHPVIYTIGQGQCTTGDTTFVLVRPLPLLSFSPNPADICVGDDIVLTISGANDYIWTPDATLSNNSGATVTANPTINTTYSVTGVDNEGCSSTIQVPLIVHPLPIVDAGANQTVCAFDPPTYIFNFSPFGGLWTGTGITDGFTGEFSPQISGPGTFTITYTATDIYNCTNQDDMVITVLNPVAAYAGTDQSVCVNEPAFNLTGFSPAGGSWQGIGITNPTLGTFNPALAGVGVHKLIYSPPSSQCIYKDSILITVLPEPTITIIASDLTLCSGQSSNITASGGNTYTWSPSGSLNTSTGATVIANPTLTTTYTVTTVDANTCTSSNTIIITMNPLPNVTITPAALAICTGQSMNLTAGGANTYTWSPSNGLNQTTGTTVTTSTTINTTYTVTGTDINGCVSTQDISVVVLQLPNLTLTEQDQWICNGSSTQLFASGAQSYTWSPFSSLNASQGSAVIASPNVTTTYTVTGTDANGCQDSDTISVTVHPPPITFNVQPQLCQWETVNLIANGANEYTWTPSFGLNTSTGASVLATPTLTTTYTVVGTDIYGCTGSNAVIVTVHFPTITINPDSAAICNGQSQVFSASGAVQYAWYPSTGLNVTTSAIVSASPSISTTYTLIGTDIYGCPDTVLVPLIVHPQPEALFTYTPPEGCDSLLVTFTNLSTDADSFLWTFSDGTNSTELNPAHWFSGPGNYDVTLYVEGTGGCNDTETITDAITVWPMPVAEFAWRQSNYPVINGEVFFDNNSLNADTYNWNFGDSTYSTAVNPSHQYQQYGTYFVTLIATNDFDCKDTIVKPISVKFYKGLYLPNAMTPEYGDPATRVFTPKGFNLKSYRIQIYDTWGNMLWESTKLTERGEPAESWDGYYNGQLLQQDVYVWKVEATFLDDTVWEGMHYPSGEIKPTGTVTILR